MFSSFKFRLANGNVNKQLNNEIFKIISSNLPRIHNFSAIQSSFQHSLKLFFFYFLFILQPLLSEYCLKAWKFVVLNYGYGLIILIIDVISRKNNITIVIFGYLLATCWSILDSLSFFHNCIEQVKVWLCSKSEANLFDGRCKSLIPNDMVRLIQCRI